MIEVATLTMSAVAPHAGAWIETGLQQTECQVLSSPPMRGRGLKPRRTDILRMTGGSPPMRGRGLKLHTIESVPRESLVAPHAGAWIETPSARPHT